MARERTASDKADTAYNTLAAETRPAVPHLSMCVAPRGHNVYRKIFLSALFIVTRQARRLPTAIFDQSEFLNIA